MQPAYLEDLKIRARRILNWGHPALFQDLLVQGNQFRRYCGGPGSLWLSFVAAVLILMSMWAKS